MQFNLENNVITLKTDRGMVAFQAPDFLFNAIYALDKELKDAQAIMFNMFTYDTTQDFSEALNYFKKARPDFVKVAAKALQERRLLDQISEGTGAEAAEPDETYPDFEQVLIEPEDLVAQISLSGDQFMIGANQDQIMIQHESMGEPSYISAAETILLIASLTAAVEKHREVQ